MNKSTFQNMKNHAYNKGKDRFHRYTHPIQTGKHEADQAAKMGHEQWRQTVQNPNMTHMQAMKAGGRAFNNNVSVTSKFTVIGLGIMILVFVFIGMFF